MKLGWNLGRVPFGTHQIAAFRRRRTDCSCDPRFADIAHDIACPIHGLRATLAAVVRDLREDDGRRLAA